MSFNPFTSVVKFVKSEPAVLINVAGAGIAAGAVFGFHLSAQDTKEVFATVAAVTGLVTRSVVTPNAKTAAQAAALASRIAALESVANTFVPSADKALVAHYEALLKSVLLGAVVAAPITTAAVASAPAAHGELLHEAPGTPVEVPVERPIAVPVPIDVPAVVAPAPTVGTPQVLPLAMDGPQPDPTDGFSAA